MQCTATTLCKFGNQAALEANDLNRATAYEVCTHAMTVHFPVLHREHLDRRLSPPALVEIEDNYDCKRRLWYDDQQ